MIECRNLYIVFVQNVDTFIACKLSQPFAQLELKRITILVSTYMVYLIKMDKYKALTGQFDQRYIHCLNFVLLYMTTYTVVLDKIIK